LPRLFSSNTFKIRRREGNWSFVFLKEKRLYCRNNEKEFSLDILPETWDAFTKEALGKGIN
jgi:hypothetical protein